MQKGGRMRRAGCSRKVILLVLLSVLLSSLPCRAARIFLRIQVGNPLDVAKTVPVKANLPAGVTTNDVIDLDGLELDYDVNNDICYVHTELELGPKATPPPFNVEIKDIWRIPSEDLQKLETRSVDLVRKMKGRTYEDEAVGLGREVELTLVRIRKRQDDKAIRPGVKTIEHIQAYEANIDELDRVRKDVGYLENLVLGTGQTVGRLIGTDRRTPKPTELKLNDAEYKKARMEIVVENSSSRERTAKDFSRHLPPEIGIHDVIDSDGLEVRTDRKTGGTYVYADKIVLGPGEKRSFSLTIRDKWNINGPRLEMLLKHSDTVLERVAAKTRYDEIEKTLRELGDELRGMREESGPETIGKEYVAFHRRQTGQLNVIEETINRIELALRAIDKSSRFGFRVKPPSPRTTWLIIYIILGFLGVVSLVFFFRWFGRT